MVHYTKITRSKGTWEDPIFVILCARSSRVLVAVVGAPSLPKTTVPKHCRMRQSFSTTKTPELHPLKAYLLVLITSYDVHINAQHATTYTAPNTHTTQKQLFIELHLYSSFCMYCSPQSWRAYNKKAAKPATATPAKPAFWPFKTAAPLTDEEVELEPLEAFLVALEPSNSTISNGSASSATWLVTSVDSPASLVEKMLEAAKTDAMTC